MTNRIEREYLLRLSLSIEWEKKLCLLALIAFYLLLRLLRVRQQQIIIFSLKFSKQKHFPFTNVYEELNM
jgi:hypothetical protein